MHLMLFNSLSKMEKVKFYTTYEYLFYITTVQSRSALKQRTSCFELGVHVLLQP